MNSASLPPLRPDSEQLVDLHVYLVPPEIWNSKYNSAYNEVINETISFGFVRVWPELLIWNLREELLNQLGPDNIPGEYVYVRSVGRCLTQVKGRQELELRVKDFLPPRNYAPEIFILEGPQDVPDTALIEARKQASLEDEGASSMEVDEDEDEDGETIAEIGKDRRLVKRLQCPPNLKKQVVKSKPIRSIKGIIEGTSPAKKNEKQVSSVKQPGTAQVNKSVTMNRLKALQKASLQRSRPPLRNDKLKKVATKTNAKGYSTAPDNNKRKNKLISKPILTVGEKTLSRNQEESKSLRSKVMRPNSSVKENSEKVEIEKSPDKHISVRLEESLNQREPRQETPFIVGQTSPDQRRPRKGDRPETFTKHSNGDSGLGEQTPQEVTERMQRVSHGPQKRDIEKYRQSHHQNDGHRPGENERLHKDPHNQRQYQTINPEYTQVSPRAYQINQNYPTRTPRNIQYDHQPPPPVSDQGPTDYNERYDHRDDPPSMGHGPTHPVGGSYQDQSPRGTYQQNELGYRPMGQGNRDPRFQERRNDPNIGHSSEFKESEIAWQSSGSHGRPEEGLNDHARNTQEAMSYLQLTNDLAPSPKVYPRPPDSDSPSEPPSSISSSNPEKQRTLNEIRDEQQLRLDMEKVREELIKKAKGLQGKTIDRRKKARDYWKKRYYEEKKKTPSLEDQVSKLSYQVQQMNRKLLSHLEGKGAKIPKGPPSKKMDHKIQIFKHQHDMDDVKRQVDNARMKLGTELKLRTQAETELRILKSEVTQKKINVTLKRGKQLQAIQKTETKLMSRSLRPTGRRGNAV